EALIEKLESEGSLHGEELRMRRHDGSEIWLSETARVVRNAAGEPLYYEGMLEDVSSRRAAEQALERSELLFRTLIENAHVGVFLVREGRLSYVNQAFAAMLGYREEELLGRPVTSLAAPQFKRCAEDLSLLAESKEGRIERECTLIASDGVRQVIGGISAAVARLGDESVTIVTVRDLTAQKATESELRHHANHDPLTGLPNRMLFREHLAAVLDESRRDGVQRHALLFAELDAFRLVTDSLGHVEGDRLLTEAVPRFQRVAGEGGVICRYGGGEFALLVEGITDRSEAEAFAERIKAEFAAPFRLGDHEIHTQLTIGIVLCGPDYESPEAVLRDADAAMATGKRVGETNHVLFDNTVRNAAMDRLQVESALRAGIARGEFELHYQPIYDLARDRLDSFEALLRWRHPERGMLEPDSFLHIAEETGLLIDLGWDGLDAALAACADWRALGADIAVSVNLSNQQFRAVQLTDRIASALERSKLPPRLLHLEITEKVFVDNPALARRTLKRLHALGVELHLDDFGTGYSALSYLSELPFDALKIDRSFVQQLPHGPRARAIVRTIIALARDLGLGVIAEGIERSEQSAALTAMDCALAQGHLLGAPLPAEDALALVKSFVASTAG
ncbi:MAG: putative bifunctional diguanylate cyclase/phosphodiesterase, partial [Gammaproteobacteria bacterium]